MTRRDFLRLLAALPGLAWFRPKRAQEPPALIPMRMFWAGPNEIPKNVWLDGQYVADQCRSFYGPVEPGIEALGWCTIRNPEYDIGNHVSHGPYDALFWIDVVGNVKWEPLIR